MIDIHSHILPGIDDGSENLEMTRAMLEASKEQGVTIQVATPHFYANHMSLSGFLLDRERAYQAALPLAQERGIALLRGAEVAHFRGMGKADGMESLLIEGTRLMLVEMPFRPWREKDLIDLENLIGRKITPILAHIERFYPFQKGNKEALDIMDAILELPLYAQVNAGEFLGWMTKSKAVKLFKSGTAQLLGSDCHNTSSRPQNLEEAREYFSRKLGVNALREMDALGHQLLGR